MEAYKSKISALEEELDQMAIQLADRDSETMELREKLDFMEKRKQSDDLMIQLASRKHGKASGDSKLAAIAVFKHSNPDVCVGK
ncbi:hypothetical protein GHT06_020354 [Daphnia sinensis]|uniref:Uncharacterized protein n=1 Tax=Daphnia sinensis TaxID=1820382 RepID=A0AAD5KLZ1_9CRUS|nr:hypothetical protein GHT06_020354 [Daphnia sinensis]